MVTYIVQYSQIPKILSVTLVRGPETYLLTIYEHHAGAPHGIFWPGDIFTTRVNPEISGGIFDFTRGIEKFVSKSREVAPSRVYPEYLGQKSSIIWSWNCTFLAETPADCRPCINTRSESRGSRLQYTRIKKKSKFCKFFLRCKEIQNGAVAKSYIWLTASSYLVKYMRISSYIKKPFLIYSMTLQPIPSESFFFFQCEIWDLL
jgi:hypothetical protein